MSRRKVKPRWKGGSSLYTRYANNRIFHSARSLARTLERVARDSEYEEAVVAAAGLVFFFYSAIPCPCSNHGRFLRVLYNAPTGGRNRIPHEIS